MKRMKLISARIAAIVIACVSFALLLGCGGGGGTSAPAADTTLPVISNPDVLDSGLTFMGGSVTLMVDVTDNVAVSSVQAAVSKDGVLIPNGNVTMTCTGGNTYRAVVTAPANTSSTPATCTVAVHAIDTSGNQSAYVQFSFDVPAADKPPSPDPNL